MVNVLKDGEIIGVVEYNNNLDIWNGSNWQNGGTGKHLGITVIENDEERCYVLIHGSDWDGEFDYGEIISSDEAFQLIMRYNTDLLVEDKFKELNKFKKYLFKEVK